MADYIIVCIPFVLAFLGALMSMEATKKHHKKFLFLIILIGIAGSIFNAIEVRESRSERETQKNMLSKIYDTLKPFSEIALAKYPKLNEKQALARLADEIKNLELSTKAQEEKIKHIEYTEVSKYNAGGNKSGGVNNVRFVPTPIDDWNRGRLISEQMEELILSAMTMQLKNVGPSLKRSHYIHSHTISWQNVLKTSRTQNGVNMPLRLVKF